MTGCARPDSHANWRAVQFTDHLLKHIEKRLQYYQSLTEMSPLDVQEERKLIQLRMSKTMGILRSREKIKKALDENRAALERRTSFGVENRSRLADYLRNEDLLFTERACLESTRFLLQSLNAGRGSYLIADMQDLPGLVTEPDGKPGSKPDGGRSLPWASGGPPDRSVDSKIVNYEIDDGGVEHVGFEPVRPIPETDEWFEQVWKECIGERRFRDHAEGDAV